MKKVFTLIFGPWFVRTTVRVGSDLHSRVDLIGLARGNDLILTTIKTIDDAAGLARAYYPDRYVDECALQILKNARQEQYAGWRKTETGQVKFFGRKTLYADLTVLF